MLMYKEKKSKSYILKKDNAFWGVEYYADGTVQSSHGVVRDTADILYFKKKIKPKDFRPKNQAWIDSAEFVEVKITKIEKVEIV